MNNTKLIRFEPSTVLDGDTVADVMIRAGITHDYSCGRHGRCGKCMVCVVPASKPLLEECAVIHEALLADGWRLACLSPAFPGMVIYYPEKLNKQRILVEGTLKNHGSFKPSDDRKYQLACDIGTTTVALYLLNPDDGSIIATASAANGQINFGSDVISRIYAVEENPVNLQRMQKAIVNTLNQLINEIIVRSGVNLSSIGGLHVAGNTTMEHLLLGVDPRSMGRSPFTPSFLRAEQKTASDLDLALSTDAKVSLVPNLSSFVGGDIVAGLYYVDICEKEGIYLFMDIGTNNEMVISKNKLLFACSAAAGPALEGTQISTGVRAVEGAVEKVWFYNKLFLSTIENVSPVGICGSGLIDLVAVLLDFGVVLPNGKFQQPDRIEQEDLRRRLRKGDKRFNEFVYCFAGEYGADRDLVLTQKDVRETQLAKSAIAVGIHKLLEVTDVRIQDIDRVYLAGAFGNYINRDNAMRLGILPKVMPETVLPVGNSAGLGVCRSVFDLDAKKKFACIEQSCQSLNLALSDDFQKMFVHYLNFDV